MIRADPFYTLGLDRSLEGLSAQQDMLTNELSSGLAVSSASDNPVAAAEGIALGSAASQDDAFVQSATSLQGQMQTADAALGSAVTQITSAISLVTGGLDGTENASDLKVVSTQLAALRDQVLSLANTSYAGSYVFAGTAGKTQPFTLNSTTTPATVTYAGDSGQQYAETPSGQKIAVSVPGEAVFASPGASVLGALNSLVADFSTGQAASSTQADMEQLSAGLNQLSAQRAALGTSLGTLQQTSSYASTNAVTLEASQSSLVATDTANVATQLSANETQQDALLNVMSTDIKNLFDYMQS